MLQALVAVVLMFLALKRLQEPSIEQHCYSQRWESGGRRAKRVHERRLTVLWLSGDLSAVFFLQPSPKEIE